MTNKQIMYFFISILALFTFSGCESEIEVELSDPELKSFKLRTIDGSATGDCVILNDTITALFTACNDSRCIPIVEGDFDYVEINGERLISGETIVDFNNVCNIECIKIFGDKEKRYSYTALIKTLNGIPRIDINTEGGAKIESKEEYINAQLTIGNTPEYGSYHGDLEIRGRGNCTWTDYPKKPYKLKFKEKVSINGLPANKDWVLLADYTDRSLMRTACMAEISKIVGLPYTINYTFADVFINGDYQGTYYVTDQVEKGKERVNISDDGFLIEDDKYYKDESIYFTTDKKQINYTFKYPKKLKASDESYLWIQSFINNVEEALYSGDETSYLDLIDIDTFARWFIIEELLGNYDSNVYYVLGDRNQKLQMYPVWDAEWSLGLAYLKDGAWQAPECGSPIDVEIWGKRLYYEELMKKPEFVSYLKNTWNKVSERLAGIPHIIDEIASTIALSQIDNFDKWQTMGDFVRVEVEVQESWDKEIDYIKSFYEQRLNWMSAYIQSL